jgi:hypothetical protein
MLRRDEDCDPAEHSQISDRRAPGRPPRNSELSHDVLSMAFQRRQPDGSVVHRSVRGAGYTPLAFSQRVEELKLDQSVLKEPVQIGGAEFWSGRGRSWKGSSGRQAAGSTPGFRS